MDRSQRLAGASLDALVKTTIGWAGLAACLTMVFLGMRAVMDVGGSCAEGGPYEIAQACPEGATAALTLGVFGGFGFGFLATIGGIALGGIWAATPILAWSALFGSLGWNFMEYGVFNPPSGEVDLGWAIPGIMFWLMAGVPLLGVIAYARGGGDWLPTTAGGGSGGGGGPRVVTLSGPGQPPASGAARPSVVTTPRTSTVTSDGRTVTVTSTVIDADLPPEARAHLEAMARRLGAAPADPTPEEREELMRIATDFGAAIGVAMADTPLDPAARASLEATGVPWPAVPDVVPEPPTGEPAGERAPEPDFTEGTQALLDRLERLADMRDRGLLGADEYDTAKAAIMDELEGRS